jgi:hypothetical protein
MPNAADPFRQVLQAIPLFLAMTLPLMGQQGPRYPAGVEGIKAGSLPPPGFYIRDYNLFYFADELNDGRGQRVAADFEVRSLALAPRALWVTTKKVLGGDFAVDLVVPFLFTDIKSDALGIHDRATGLGDILTDLGLVWHGDRFDAIAAGGVFAPTGDFDVRRPASPGRGFWTGLLTLGGTCYIGADKQWSCAVLNRFEIHSQNTELKVTPGHHWVSEFSLSRKLGPIVELGVAGYAQYQITDDAGPGVSYDRKAHDRVFGLGPEAIAFVPKWKILVSLRYEREFAAADRPQGNLAVLTLTRRW